MTDEQLRELRAAIKREALLEYRDALLDNRGSAEYWHFGDFIYDIEEWAKEMI